MTKASKKIQQEFVSHVNWDPNDTAIPPTIDINTTKARHVAKRYLVEQGYESSIEKETGLTVYNFLKNYHFGDIVLLIADKVTVEVFVAFGLRQHPKDRNGHGKYGYVTGATKETVYSFKDAQQVLKAIELEGPDVIESKSLGTLEIPDGAAKTAIDALLGQSKLPTIDDILSAIHEEAERADSFASDLKKTQGGLELSEKEVKRLADELTNAMLKAEAAPIGTAKVKGDGTIPNGEVTHKKASEVFPGVTFTTDFEVPFWEWDGPHPDVPAIDENYVFRPDLLTRVIYAIVTNQRAYLHGHTGSGKTTLIEQVAAHLNYPFVRVNFDSEVTRMDLIGRDVLASDGKKVTSKFVDGMLPRAMSQPCIFVADEIDFVRPDVAYVMQAALEGNGLRITEDGDRLVEPHPMMRMMATGNTVGQGDEHGMYQGARPQSLALLDRFTVWAKVPYLDGEQRESLVSRHFPSLKDDDKKALLLYIENHLAAFEQKDVIQPISPRGMLATAKATLLLGGNIKEALNMVVLDKANADDYATLKGLVDRVVK